MLSGAGPQGGEVEGARRGISCDYTSAGVSARVGGGALPGRGRREDRGAKEVEEHGICLALPHQHVQHGHLGLATVKSFPW